MQYSSSETTPQVSAVLTTYERDDFKFFCQALESLLGQDYLNLQVIVVSDGWIPELSQRYLEDLERDGEVLWIKCEKNIGVARARNLGIQAATGDFIAIMDADDISMSERIAKQMFFLIHSEADLSSSVLTIIDNNGTVTGERWVPQSPAAIKWSSPFMCPMNNPSAFGKAEVFKELGYAETLVVAEDYDLWVRAIKAGWRLANSSQSVVLYRQDKNSLDKRRGLRYFLADFQTKRQAIGFFPPLLRPVVCVLSLLSCLPRILPRRVFAIIYSVRRNTLFAPDRE
jgi:glycosyltransferase involved in cell wall biosynthesis